MCYCQGCGAARGDVELYERGDPSRPYVVPVGWIRLGLVVDASMAGIHDIFENWNIAYHGMSLEKMFDIFASGRRLLVAGDVGMEGTHIGIRKYFTAGVCMHLGISQIN